MEERRKVEMFMFSKIQGKLPFIKTTEFVLELGYFPKEILNQMFAEKLIQKREGINTPLVEVLPEGIIYLTNIHKL